MSIFGDILSAPFEILSDVSEEIANTVGKL